MYTSPWGQPRSGHGLDAQYFYSLVLVGFWHGAAWNYIIWGLFFAVFLILEKCFIKRLLGRLPSFFAHLYALFFLTLSFAIFNAEGPGQGMAHILGMFGFRDVPLASAETIYYLKSYLYVFSWP